MRRLMMAALCATALLLTGCTSGDDAPDSALDSAPAASGPDRSASLDGSLTAAARDVARRGGTNTETLADMPDPRPTPPSPVPMATSLRGPEAFTSITDDQQRSIALFDEMMNVIGHPRCMNCHNADGPITQGDAMDPHQPMIARGDDTFGNPGMRCGTCHEAENVDYLTAQGSIPGHDPWHVAPREMAWQGLTVGQICAQIKDVNRNGGRSLDEIWEHNAKDGLVGWGWEPGSGRTPVPGTQARFGALTRAWIDSGAACRTG